MKNIFIVSGYFNPINKEYLKYFHDVKVLADELFVIVNNDHQIALKRSKKFQNDDKRMIIVSNIKKLDKAIFTIDEDRTFYAILKMIADKHGTKFELAFANVEDQYNSTSLELPTCEEVGVDHIDGIEYKIQSSNWLLK